MKKQLGRIIGPVLILAMLLGALWMLHSELKQYHLSDFIDGLKKRELLPDWHGTCK